MEADFYNQVIPAVERALAQDLPDIEYQLRVPGTRPEDKKFRNLKRRPHRTDVEVTVFSQSWSDTSLGFGGVAGQAFTNAYTTVIISEHRIAAVYIGSQLAYLCEVTQEFMEDVRNRNMRGQCEVADRYKLLARKKIEKRSADESAEQTPFA